MPHNSSSLRHNATKISISMPPDFLETIFEQKGTIQRLSCMMKSILNIGLVAVAAVFLSACNTVGGVGKDVSSVGDAMGQAAKDTSKAIDKGVDSM